MTPSSLPIRIKHITPIQIRFNDVDIAAHVNNAIYMEYSDLAKMHYFNEVFKNTINWKEKGFVLASATLDYLEPVYLNEEIVVETITQKIGEKSLEILQVVRKKDSKGDNGVKCIIKSIMVAYDYKEAHAIIVEDQWRKCLIEFEGDFL